MVRTVETDFTKLAMTKPRSVDPLADEILNRLSEHPEASEIVLGGYFALQHYADYRRTHDLDAWWRSHASKPADDAIRSVMTPSPGNGASCTGSDGSGNPLV